MPVVPAPLAPSLRSLDGVGPERRGVGVRDSAGRHEYVRGHPVHRGIQFRQRAGECHLRVIDAGAEPAGASVIKIANNFVLGCAIEALGEGFALTRKYGIAPEVFFSVLTDGLFNCPAYKSYGTIISGQKYLPAGQRAMNGLKDANLALAAGEAVGVPLPSGNVWRDRLIGAVAHGEGEHDWAVMAQDQARASGLD